MSAGPSRWPDFVKHTRYEHLKHWCFKFHFLTKLHSVWVCKCVMMFLTSTKIWVSSQFAWPCQSFLHFFIFGRDVELITILIPFIDAIRNRLPMCNDRGQLILVSVQETTRSGGGCGQLERTCFVFWTELCPHPNSYGKSLTPSATGFLEIRPLGGN